MILKTINGHAFIKMKTLAVIIGAKCRVLNPVLDLLISLSMIMLIRLVFAAL
jgi:hypothetical protein